MKHVLWSFFFLLAGCGSSGSSDEDNDKWCTQQYNTASVQVGESGLMLQPANNMYVTFSQIEEFYIQTQACVGVIATGPLVIYENFMGPMGLYSFNQEVRINTNIYWERDCKTDEQILKKEFVHHLLHLGGFPFEDNLNHNSPLFEQCSVV